VFGFRGALGQSAKTLERRLSAGRRNLEQLTIFFQLFGAFYEQ
jgi:hypothetical protein